MKDELNKNISVINHNDFLSEAKEFFETNKKAFAEDIKSEDKVIHLDYTLLLDYSPELVDSLLESPEETFQLLEIAFEELEWTPNNMKIRITNLPQSNCIPIRKIRSKHLGRLISVEGVIRQTSEVRPKVTNIKFECQNCGSVISIKQIVEQTKPKRCSCGNRGSFKEISKDLIDSQSISIEEPYDILEYSTQPKKLTILLGEDLTEPNMEDKTTPGNTVTVIGILKEIERIKNGTKSLIYEICVKANNIIPMQDDFINIEVSESDEEEIKKIAKDNPLDKLVNSFAPSICGNKEIKKALVLQLFGGNGITRVDGTMRRGEINILLVGDGGTSKSMLLKYTGTLAPKSRYVSGMSTSGVGITASVVRDELTGNWSLTAGAMVLANNGCVLIDELDKMNIEDRSNLHEAMSIGCYEYNTKIRLSNGKEIIMGEFIERTFNKHKQNVVRSKYIEYLDTKELNLLTTSFDKHSYNNICRISKHKNTKPLINIKLQNGRDITITDGHPCFVVRDGKIVTIPARDVTTKDFVPIPLNQKLKTKEFSKTIDNLCKIIGYHVSDGCYELNRGKKNGIQFSNCDDVLINDYKIAIKKYFNKTPCITTRGNVKSVRVISMNILKKIEQIESTLIEKKKNRKIPEFVFSLNMRNISTLIRAIFDGDGSVSVSNNSPSIILTSSSSCVLFGVQELLQFFGIRSMVKMKKTFGRLHINGIDNCKKYFLKIGFLSINKQKKLSVVMTLKNKQHSHIDLIPNCARKIHSIFKELHIPIKPTLNGQIQFNKTKAKKLILSTMELLKKYINKHNLEVNETTKKDIVDIEKIVNDSIAWEKVDTITHVDNVSGWAYDLTIEPNHTFISNGMILHNTITISKATVQASLKCKTSVLAAANPRLGRFNSKQSIVKQINLVPTLLSRFDCIFVLRDVPNKDKDSQIADRILSEEIGKEVTLDSILIRKYVAFAKKNIKPEITKDAVTHIKKFYIKLRNSYKSEGDSIPMGARQLETLIRLSEASAKIRLSKTVELEDTQVAIDVVMNYLRGVGFDNETGKFDIDMVSGTGSSERKRIEYLLTCIQNISNGGNGYAHLNDITKLVNGKLTEKQIEGGLFVLNRQGDIIKTSQGYKKI